MPNPRPNQNWGNIGGGAESAATRIANGTARGNPRPSNNNTKKPAAAAVSNMEFFKLAHAMQCIDGVAYSMHDTSHEAIFFKTTAAEIPKHCLVIISIA